MKKKRKKQLIEAWQATALTGSLSESFQQMKVPLIQNDTGDLIKLKKKMKIKKKRLKEETELREESGHVDNSEHSSTTEKANKKSTALVVLWDSQVKDGYKRNQAPAPGEKERENTPVRTATTVWDGKKTSGVVEELLKNATDKAYGANVLSWDGDASAISRDAAEDARHAKCDTVIDEWDEEFDRGKVKKVKNYKREKWRSGSSIFQKIQDQRNKWSVTPGGKRAFGIRR